MATIKPLYGTSNQAITCTITSLASAAFRQSATIDNSTNLYLDILVTLKAKSNAAGVSATGTLELYAGGMTDGLSLDGGLSGSDAAYTPPVTVNSRPANLKFCGLLNLNGNAQTDQATFSLAQAFGGELPQKFALAVYNNTGAALDAAVGSLWYQGVQAQSV